MQGGGLGGGSCGLVGGARGSGADGLAVMAAWAAWWRAFDALRWWCGRRSHVGPYTGRRRRVVAGVKTSSGSGQTDGGGVHASFPS